MWPILGRQDPGGPHVGPMNFAIRDVFASLDDNELIEIDPSNVFYVFFASMALLVLIYDSW